MKIFGFASGLRLRSSSYDPTGRSVFYIKIDNIPKIFNPAIA
ncbi:hypothetical protein D1AOALGA4SA_5400 [Olavius algarvensis Delta 1 endosymbiont]|nr:hypothetical protein D1AOALGA4SA_5400 [Olavius algarvensis Delta 1 endosymbiont]